MQLMKAVVAMVLAVAAVATAAFLLLQRPAPRAKAPAANQEALAPGAMTPIRPAIEFLLLPGTPTLRQREFRLAYPHRYAVELLQRKLPSPAWTCSSTTARHYPDVKRYDDEAPHMWSESLTTLITRRKRPGEKTAPMIKVHSIAGRGGASHAKATLTVYPAVLER
jgi:hypothetical protein